MPEEAAIPTDQIEFEVSPGRKVTMKSLNGADIRTVNRITGQNIGNAGENQALYSLVSINGEELIPARNDMHLENRASKFNAREYIKLIEEFGKAFYEDISDPK